MEHTTDYATIKESIALAITIHELKEIRYHIDLHKGDFTPKQLQNLTKLLANAAMVLTDL